MTFLATWIAALTATLPRPTEAEDITSLEEQQKPWDHTDKHEEIHEHTQD